LYLIVVEATPIGICAAMAASRQWELSVYCCRSLRCLALAL
jgi:hypothetical protein